MEPNTMLHNASNIELAFSFVQKSSKSHIKTDLLTTTTFAFAARSEPNQNRDVEKSDQTQRK